MRIKRLEFENINSLKGKWSINFEDQAYLDSPLFAICGPTGSGKSSLLDAMCLALFGKTPRQSSISKDSDEVMSHETTQASASLWFSAGGREYAAHWKHRRATRGGSNNLQAPTVSLEEITASGTTTLSNQIKSKATMLKDKIGLDFDQFTKSVLLAQGSFSVFLKSDEKQRSEILEKITGTKIYSEIGTRAFERHKEVTALLDKKQEALEDLKVWTPEEFKQIEEESENLTKRVKELRTETNELQKLKKWKENLSAASEKLQKAEEELKLAQDAKTDTKEDELRLEISNKAEKIKSIHALLDKNQKDTKNETKSIDGLRIIIDKMEGRVKELTAQSSDLSNALEDYKKETQVLRKDHNDIRSLDQTIKDLEKAKKDAEKQVKLRREKAVATSKELSSMQTQKDRLEKELKSLDKWIAEHGLDGKIFGALGSLNASVKELKNLEKELKSRERNQKKAQKDAEEKENRKQELLKKSSLLDKELDKALTVLEEKSKTLAELGRDPEEITTEFSELVTKTAGLNQLKSIREDIKDKAREKDSQSLEVKRLETEEHSLRKELAGYEKTLELLEEKLGHLQKIEEQKSLIEKYEIERRKLSAAPGQACPVCGSTDHPYCSGLPDFTEVDEIDKTKKEKTSTDKKSNKTRGELAENAGALTQARKNLQATEKFLSTKNKELEEMSESLGMSGRMSELDEDIEKCQERHGALKTLLESVQKAVKAEKTAQKKAEELKEASQKAKLELTSAESQAKSAEETANVASEELEKAQTALTEKRNEFNKEAEPFVANPEDEKPEKIVEGLTQRSEEFERNSKDREDKNIGLTAVDKSLSGIRERLEVERQNQEDAEKALNERRQDLDKQKTLRKERYGSRDPNQEEIEFSKEEEKRQKNLSIAVDERNQKEKDLEGAKSSLKSSVNRLDSLRTEAAQLEKEWSEKLAEQGFADEDAWNKALMSEAEARRLSEKLSGINKRLSETQGAIKGSKEDFERLKEQNLTEKTTDELSASISANETESEDLNQKLGSLQKDIENNEKNRKEAEELRKELERMTADSRKWILLNQLIGSKDGAAYRKFVQQLTFDAMVAQANVTLRKISDRFELLRTPPTKNSFLELSVIDSYHLGEVRPVSNLSGGETFIVSLALALGLSRMASKNIRIDSLFLDEGFGSLDEDTLSTALDVLASLNNEGKIIGVISHIGQVKERIPARIEVTPAGGGFSRISGPGVSSRS